MKKIIILHGWTYSLDKWQKFIKLLSGAGYEVDALEIPGLTFKSDEIWDLEKYTMWLKEKVGNKKTILLGHSNGGRIAINFAAKYPNNIEKLILMNAAGIYHKEITLQIKRFLFGAAARVGKKLVNKDGLKKFLYWLAREKDYKDATPDMKQTMINLIKVDLKEMLSKIKTDTLIIWGKEDKTTPLSDGVLMNQFIEKSRLRIIDSARHSPFYTHPEEVVKIITNDI